MANAQTEEQQILAETSNSIDEYIIGEREQITISAEELDKLIQEKVDEAVAKKNLSRFSLTKLGTTNSTSYVAVDLPSGIEEYRYIYMQINNEQGRIYASAFTPVSDFINIYNSSTSATSLYFSNPDNSYYGYCYYSNNKLYIRVTNDAFYMSVYGVK